MWKICFSWLSTWYSLLDSYICLFFCLLKRPRITYASKGSFSICSRISNSEKKWIRNRPWRSRMWWTSFQERHKFLFLLYHTCITFPCGRGISCSHVLFAWQFGSSKFDNISAICFSVNNSIWFSVHQYISKLQDHKWFNSNNINWWTITATFSDAYCGKNDSLESVVTPRNHKIRYKLT